MEQAEVLVKAWVWEEAKEDARDECDSSFLETSPQPNIIRESISDEANKSDYLEETLMNKPKVTGNQARVRRYRTLHRRIDYVPSPDVLAIIQHHLKIGTDCFVAGVIDYLIRTAHHAIPGNGGR